MNSYVYSDDLRKAQRELSKLTSETSTSPSSSPSKSSSASSIPSSPLSQANGVIPNTSALMATLEGISFPKSITNSSSLKITIDMPNDSSSLSHNEECQDVQFTSTVNDGQMGETLATSPVHVSMNNECAFSNGFQPSSLDQMKKELQEFIAYKMEKLIDEKLEKAVVKINENMEKAVFKIQEENKKMLSRYRQSLYRKKISSKQDNNYGTGSILEPSEVGTKHKLSHFYNFTDASTNATHLSPRKRTSANTRTPIKRVKETLGTLGTPVNNVAGWKQLDDLMATEKYRKYLVSFIFMCTMS